MGANYGGKPRPVAIIQHSYFELLDSVTFCGSARDPTETVFRIPIEPSPSNGLTFRSCITVDKIPSVPKSKLGHRDGELTARDITRLDQAPAIFLGLNRPA